MAVSKHTRRGEVRRHIKRTTDSHMNDKKIDSKLNRKNKEK